MQRSWLRLFLAAAALVGVGVAYLVFSGLGEGLLHREIETQLGRLLAGPVSIAQVEVRLEDGLRLEINGLEAYPSPDPNGQPALKANRVLAWIDLLALLIGRLELSTLIVDGPQLRVIQDAEGSLVAFPLLSMPSDSEDEGDPSTAERFARRFEALYPAATAFIESFRAADRIEIQNGTLIWIDRSRLDEAGSPQERRLELVTGIAERDWLSGVVDLTSSAVFVDGKHAPFPIEFEIHSEDGPHLAWTASFLQIPLDAARTPLSLIQPIEGLDGTLDANFKFKTTAAGEHRLTFKGIVEGATVTLRQSKAIEQERVEVRAELKLNKRSLEIVDGHMNGVRLGLDFKSTIERPLRFASTVRIESRMIGARIDGIRELAEQFSEQSEMAFTIAQVTKPIESGRIRYIQASGTAKLRHWQQLASGESRTLPDDFLLGAAVEAIEFGTGSNDSIEDLAGELEWVEDQISLRRMNAVYRDQPLPELNVTIDGISHLIRASESAEVVTLNPPPIPGASPLGQIFRPRDPNALPPIKAVGLAIDRLDHPLLRWPLRDVRALIEPLRRGVQVNVREGTWGGAAVKGEVVWLNDPETPSVDARLKVGPAPKPPVPDAPALETTLAAQNDAGASEGRWGSGRFEIEFRPRPSLPFRTGVGYFRLEGAKLLGHEVEIELVPKGQAALRTTIDMRDPDFIDLDLSFAITEAAFKGMSEFVLIPAGMVSGDVGATGSLAGLVRPDVSFIAELDGKVRVEASEGSIETNVPLLLRLGKATEGYNPFANEDELHYESMTGTLGLEQGVLIMEDFEIEGPLRVFANARLNTNRSPGRIKAVVGIFLFRSSGQFLENLPLVRSFLPGSEKGLIGAYFEVKGPIDEPDVEALPLQTLMASVPSAIKAPFKVMQFLFGRDEKDK